VSELLGQGSYRGGVIYMYSFFMILGFIAGVVLIGSALIASLKEW
jgi:hypothetical protein